MLDDLEKVELLPFIKELPTEDLSYHPIIKPPQSARMRSGFVTLESGAEVGEHSTHDHEEMLVVLQGHGEVEIEGQGRQKIHKGCVAYIPPQTQHNVHNMNEEPLRYLYIVSRAE